RDAIEELADDHQGTVLRWRKAGADIAMVAQAAPAAPTLHDVPDWLRRNAPGEKSAPRSIAPSGARAFADAHALARGRVLHRLLQALPAIPPERRHEAAQRHVARVKELDAPEQQTIVDEVLRLIDDARFAALFATPAR